MSGNSVTSRRTLLLALFSAGVTISDDTNALASAENESAWLSFQGDARNSGNTENPGPTDAAAIDWTFDTEGPMWGTPVVFGDHLFVGDFDGTIYCIEASSGTQKWTYTIGDWFPMSAAFVDETVVFAKQNSSARIVGLDAKDGSVRWQRSIEEGSPNAPTLYDGDLFVSVSSGGLASYTASGERRWYIDVDHRIRTIPAVADDTVVVGSVLGLHAVDAETGERHWEYPIETAPTYVLGSSPTISDGTVFYGGGWGANTRIVGLDLDDGSEVFEYATETPIDASPAVTDDRLVVGTATQLLALDWREGTRLWRRKYDGREVDAQFDPIGNARPSSPIISGDTVYVGTRLVQSDEGGRVYGFSLDDGRTNWRLDVDDEVNASPVVADGRLFVGDASGTLYAISEESVSSLNSFSMLKEIGLASGVLTALGGGTYAAWRRWGRSARSEDS